MVLLVLNATSFVLAFPFAALVGSYLIKKYMGVNWGGAVAQAVMVRAFSGAVLVVGLPVCLLVLGAVGGVLPRSIRYFVIAVSTIAVEGVPVAFGPMTVACALAWFALSWVAVVPIESAVLRSIWRFSASADGKASVARSVALRTNLLVGPAFLATVYIWRELLGVFL